MQRGCHFLTGIRPPEHRKIEPRDRSTQTQTLNLHLCCGRESRTVVRLRVGGGCADAVDCQGVQLRRVGEVQLRSAAERAAAGRVQVGRLRRRRRFRSHLQQVVHRHAVEQTANLETTSCQHAQQRRGTTGGFNCFFYKCRNISEVSTWFDVMLPFHFSPSLSNLQHR